MDNKGNPYYQNTNTTMEITITRKLNNTAAYLAKNLLDMFGDKLPNYILRFVYDSQNYGKGIFCPTAIRIGYRVRVLNKCFGFVLGYISEDELLEEYKYFKTFDKKFWNYGEYSRCSVRLLPMY